MANKGGCGQRDPSGTILRFPIPRLLGLGFAGKCDHVRRTHGVKARTASEMIDFAAHIPPHRALTCSGRWCLRRSRRWQMTGVLREDIREAIPRQHGAAFGKGFDSRDVVRGEDLAILWILTAPQLPVAVGLLFRHAKALLSGPALKPSFRQCRKLRAGMGPL